MTHPCHSAPTIFPFSPYESHVSISTLISDTHPYPGHHGPLLLVAFRKLSNNHRRMGPARPGHSVHQRSRFGTVAANLARCHDTWTCGTCSQSYSSSIIRSAQEQVITVPWCRHTVTLPPPATTRVYYYWAAGTV
eukprot:766499-Hanusia_phi.AAC.3